MWIQSNANIAYFVYLRKPRMQRQRFLLSSILPFVEMYLWWWRVLAQWTDQLKKSLKTSTHNSTQVQILKVNFSERTGSTSSKLKYSDINFWLYCWNIHLHVMSNATKNYPSIYFATIPKLLGFGLLAGSGSFLWNSRSFNIVYGEIWILLFFWALFVSTWNIFIIFIKIRIHISKLFSMTNFSLISIVQICSVTCEILCSNKVNATLKMGNKLDL